ncbi:thioredoxin family protein [Aureispira]|nr:thioredoxin family protein [Aureispira sp.]
MQFILTYFLLFFCFQFSIAGDGITFFEGTFKEAKALAAKEHKIIFMDAYASWCGPCKRMAKEVFTNSEVGKFYNKHFINIKVDMEKGEGPGLSNKYHVNSYPTLFFLDDKGEVVHVSKGGKPIDQFIELGKLALSKNNNSEEYAKKYESGDRSPTFLRAYAYALLRSIKPHMKIANEYIKTQKNLSNKENLEFLFDFSNEADSRIFDLAIQNKTLILELKSQTAFEQKIREACDATIKKAIEFDVKSLVDDAKQKMKYANPKFFKEYSFLADMKYAIEIEDMQTYVALTDKYLKKYAKKDAKSLNEYANSVLFNTSEKKLLEKAENWAKKATLIDYNKKHLKTHGAILHKLGKEEEAKIILQKGKELKEDSSTTPTIIQQN